MHQNQYNTTTALLEKHLLHEKYIILLLDIRTVHSERIVCCYIH